MCGVERTSSSMERKAEFSCCCADVRWWTDLANSITWEAGRKQYRDPTNTRRTVPLRVLRVVCLVGLNFAIFVWHESFIYCLAFKFSGDSK